MQLKASIKKEIMELFRRKTFFVFILGLFVFSILDPAMLKLSESIIQQMNTTQTQQSEDANMSIEYNVDEETFSSSFTSTIAHSSYLSDASAMGLLAMLLSMMNTAGGEQKKRKCVIPICSGLNRKTYILAKFIVFGVLTVLASVVFFYLGYIISNAFYPGGDYAMQYTLIPLLAFTIYLLYNVFLMIALSSITGQAGLSALIIFLFNTIVSTVVTLIEKMDFHPYGLSQYFTPHMEELTGEYVGKLLASCGITLALCAVFIILATKLFSKKQLI